MRRRLALAVLLAVAISGSAAALAQGAARLRVVGIAPNEVLHLREAPAVSARITGTIPPGGRGVVALGPGRRGWLPVRWGDAEGWALAAYLSADVPIGRRGPPRAAQAGWWVLLGSFSDPAGTPGSVARTGDLARQCGIRVFAAASSSFSDLAQGFTVVVSGPYRGRAEAEAARAQAAPCLPQAYVKYSGFSG